MSDCYQLSLSELIIELWKQKLMVILVTAVFAIASVFGALSLPNIYQSSVLLAPRSADNDMRSIGAELGGLAALTGLTAGSGNTEEVNLALQTLTSRAFVKHFIETQDMLVPLIAIDSWSDTTGEITIDPVLFDIDANQWVRVVEAPKTPKPSDWEAHKVFVEQVKFEKLKESGFVRLSFTSQSPVLAQKWVSALVVEVNKWVKQADIKEINRNIDYLTSQMKKTELSSMQRVFNNLIEEQVKRLMLAEAQDEYVFRTIDPAVVPEERVSPKRALLCVLGTMLGGIVAVLIAMVRRYRKTK